jgi:hypothetical protein
MEVDENPVTGRTHGEFTWCANCQRVGLTHAWNVGIWCCPYCGGIARDARPWEEVRKVHPAYPERPDPGASYPWSVRGA